MFAQNATCPKCAKRMILTDVTVTTKYAGLYIETCGKVVVMAGARLALKSIKAGGGIEVHGAVESTVVSGGPVVLGPSATWAGDLRAPSIHVSPGASVVSGKIEIKPVEMDAA